MAAHSACDFGGKSEKLALARISTLRELFPHMENKKKRALLHLIKGKASLLAALDYFISASPGNMHNALVGDCTYRNLKTIRPNMALMGHLFLNKTRVIRV
ncbi:hypothetical protein VIGAN_04248900 [Vigna angularis var. angularis]|uniref:Uncharacterized protein n=1 Tax=Vigna angularis var. angularis TaxID=157739 RepID=A0A0S3RWQ9_PHAAN|nr:hypothetical protein VIGAN_04248900 [Vigna angularis var. angularis]